MTAQRVASGPFGGFYVSETANAQRVGPAAYVSETSGGGVFASVGTATGLATALGVTPSNTVAATGTANGAATALGVTNGPAPGSTGAGPAGLSISIGIGVGIAQASTGSVPAPPTTVPLTAWTPAAYTTAGNIVCLYDVSNTSTFNGATGAGTDLLDLSGNSQNAVVFAGSSQPTRTAGGAQIGGFDTARFAAGTNGLKSTTAFLPAASTIIMLARVNTSAQANTDLLNGSAGTASPILTQRASNVSTVNALALGALSGDPAGALQLYSITNIAAGATARLNATYAPTQSGAFDNFTSRSLFIGSDGTAAHGASMDLAVFCVLNIVLNDGERQRFEGYFAWEYGQAVAQSVLPTTHPYYTAAPQAVVGFTPTEGTVYARTTSYDQQTYAYKGFLQETQFDVLNNGVQPYPDDPAVITPAVTTSINATGRNYLANQIMTAQGGDSVRLCRFGLGLHYRGLTNANQNFIQRWATQNAEIKALLTAAGTEGMYVEYWSPAPAFKSNTSLLGGAGVGLNAPATGDPGYAAWIDNFTTCMVTDLENVHTNILPVLAFSPQNENKTSVANYASCAYTAQQYYDVLKSVIPKINASTILAWKNYPTNTIPNTVLISYDSSENGFFPNSLSKTLVEADSALLALITWNTGHELGNVPPDADYIKKFPTAFTYTNPNTGIPYRTFIDEFEYLSPATIANGAPWLFSNTMLYYCWAITFLNSPYLTFIYSTRPYSDNTVPGYPISVYNPTGVPVPSGPYVGLGSGLVQSVPQNLNAVQMILGNIPRETLEQNTLQNTFTAGCGFCTFKNATTGKTIVLLVNRNSSPSTFEVSFDIQGTITLSGKQYDETTQGTPLGSLLGNPFTFTLPAYKAQIWVQQ